MARSSARFASLAALGMAFLGVVTPNKSWAWGIIGHRMVAETAAILLEKELPKTWGPLFSRYRVELGYYSLLPDTTFRNHDGGGGKIDSPTHYFDIDVSLKLDPGSSELKNAAQNFPRRFEDAKKFLKEKNIEINSVGTAPWRAEQFEYLAWKALKSVKKPEGGYLQGAKSTGDTRRIFDGLFYLGVLAHYTADITMPYHSTSDWNAYKLGQGGIHFYYESDCVDALEPGLSSEVLEMATKNRETWLKQWDSKKDSLAGMMISLLGEGYTMLPKINQLDKDKLIVQGGANSTSETLEGSYNTHTRDAKRKPTAEGCPALRANLIEQLAEGAVLTAYAWQSVLPTKVDFSKATKLKFSDLEMSTKFVPLEFRIPEEFYRDLKSRE